MRALIHDRGVQGESTASTENPLETKPIVRETMTKNLTRVARALVCPRYRIDASERVEQTRSQ